MIPYLLHSRKILLKPRPSNRFSPEMLEWQYDELHRKLPVTSRTKGAIIETLREMTELMIWGDQHNPAIFDLFCEKQMLAFFMEILDNSHNDSEVGTQLLQTLYMIMENVKSEITLYYLLSSNRVNQLIRYEFDFRSEELLAFYISLLKSIALRVNNDTIQFFFNETSEDFPLYTSAIAFFNHKDSMVRIAVRTIALSIIRIDNDNLRSFIVSQHARHYFSNLAESLQTRSASLLDLLDKSTQTTVVPNVKPSGEQIRLANQLEQIITVLGDEIYYVHDLLSCGVEPVEGVVFSNLIDCWLFQILPMLLNTDSSSSSNSRPSSINSTAQQPTTSQITTTYTLAQVLHIFSYSPLISGISIQLIHPNPTDYSSRYPPDFSFSSIGSPTGSAGNVYRDSLLSFMGCGDRYLLLGLAVLFSLTKNHSVSRVLLEESGLKPLRFIKSKQLLGALTEAEGDAPTGARKINRARATTLIRRRMAISPSATTTTEHPLLSSAAEPTTAATSSLFDVVDDDDDLGDEDDPFGTSFGRTGGLQSSSQSDSSSSSSSSGSGLLSSSSSVGGGGGQELDSGEEQSEPEQQTDLVEMLLATLEARQAYRMTTLHLTTQLLTEMLYIPKVTVHSKSRARIRGIFNEACTNLLNQRERLPHEELLTLLYEELREWRHPAFDVILSSGATILLGHPDSHARRVLAHTSAPAARAVRMFQEFFLLLEFHLVIFAGVEKANLRDVINKSQPPLQTLPDEVQALLANLASFAPANLRQARSSSSLPATPGPMATPERALTPKQDGHSIVISKSESQPVVRRHEDAQPSAEASSSLSTSPKVATVTYSQSPKPLPFDPVELQEFREQFPSTPKTPPRPSVSNFRLQDR